ncbi:FecR domain-containing protein [Novosphingobium sp.]|uniref:FecR family protein n=1 Tax=Novosphingobium sp. TaxID=1874826 RepID=UPI00333E4724
MTGFDSHPADMVTRAAQWHVESAGDAMDWDAFTLWLEADPRHRACYDEIALADALVADHAADLAIPAVMPAEPARAQTRRWTRRWSWVAAGVAAAASLALVVIMPGWRTDAPQVTVAGDSARMVALADGSRVTLAPHSRLTVAGDQLALNGEAHFAIRHDPSRVLRVAAGPLTITDIGTVFDVATGQSAVRIAVSEGKVAVHGAAGADAVELGQGDGLIHGDGGDMRQVPGAGLGLAGWASGSLSYAAAPLPLVAEDIARLTGTVLTVSSALRGRRFSGSLSVAPGAHTARDLATIMNLRLVTSGKTAVLEPAQR